MASTILPSRNIVSVVGIQRSGTNYLNAFLNDNIGEGVVAAVFWKHAFLGELTPELLDFAPIVLIARHPVMWLQSCIRNSSADMFETRREFFGDDSVEAGCARLYNKFYGEWLAHIDQLGGYEVRYEALLGDGDVRSDLLITLTGNSLYGRENIVTEFSNIPESIAFTEADRIGNLRIECSLSRDMVDSFWSTLSRDVINRLNYKYEDINYIDSDSDRSLVYRLLRSPGAATIAEFDRIKVVGMARYADNYSILNALGLRGVADGNVVEAVNWFRQATRACLRLEGPAYEELERKFFVVYTLERIIELTNGNAALRVGDWAEQLYRDQRDHERALCEVEDFVDRVERGEVDDDIMDDVGADYTFYLGELHHRRNRPDAAIRHMEKAIERRPYSASFHIQLGNLYLVANRLAEAEAAARRAAELDPWNPLPFHTLSLILENRRCLQDAVGAANRAVELGEGDSVFVLHHARLLAEAGQLEKAEARVREAIQLSRSIAEQYAMLSELLERQGRLAEALVEQENAVGCPNATAWHFHRHGNLLSAHDRFAEAEASVRRAIALDPADARHHMLHSEVLDRLGRIDAALAAAAMAIAADNAEPRHFQQHRYLLIGAGRLDEAEADIRLALTREPQDAGLHWLLSDTYRRRGRWAEALKTAEAMFRCDNVVAWHYHHYATLLSDVRRFAEAANNLRIAIEMEPDYVGHRDALHAVLGRQAQSVAAPHKRSNGWAQMLKRAVVTGEGH